MLQSCGNDIPGAAVHGLTCLDGGIHISGMPHHIGIGEIQTYERGFPFLQFGNDRVTNFVCAHLGFKVIGGDLRRRTKNALLSFKRLFSAPVKKEGDVRVLFGFGNPDLLFSCP